MNRFSILTLGMGVALVLLAEVASTTPSPRSIRTNQVSASASFQVAAHVAKRSGYIVASS
ncbi:MAG: hypothetical protein JWN53_568 [Gemmatimonadetes bacterium]|jgi:hypothetical protein|nr:hypothetical protein [Gemmatimonadota bacterium]